ncbi:MAG: hypothetical protein QM680_14630 [Luteolibacter sp.]
MDHSYRLTQKSFLMLPTPNELFSRFESGEIDRDELQAMMSLHARELIREMEEDHQNPVAALVETFLSKRVMVKLTERYGEGRVREVLVALSRVPDAPFAGYLWNASHPDLPLYSFLRMRREPVLRLVAMDESQGRMSVKVEFGPAKRGQTRSAVYHFVRDAHWNLVSAMN